MAQKHGDRQREPLVRVAAAESPFAAQLVSDQLKEAGIRSTIRNRMGASIWIGPMSGDYEVFVLASEAALANQALGGPPPESLPSPSLPSAGSPPPGRASRRRRWWRA